MKDIYSPEDFLFEKIKDNYQNELKGPSLKNLSENKRIRKGIILLNNFNYFIPFQVIED